jgi:glycosyltransferase involved in cell wall biosynthesis
MVRKGHDVTVYTTDAAHIGTRARIKKNFRLINGVKVFYFPNVARPYGLFISPGIVQALRENLSGFDIVHLHEYRTFQNLAFYYSGKRNAPYALTVHGQLEIRQEPLDVHILRRSFDYTFGKRLLKDASKIFALTELESSQLIQRGVDKDKIVIIPNAIDPEDFCDLPPRGYFKKQLGLDNEEIILYLGRISSLKGLDILVKAFSLLRKPNNFKLVLAGPDDGFSNSLHRIIKCLKLKGKILFAGTLNRQQVLGALNDATVTVYATIQEGFPMVPLEAGIMGKPIIVSNHPSVDFVKKGRFGLGVDYGNAAQLKDALERILDDRVFAEELGENGKKYVMKNFSWGTIAETFENEYRQLAGSP